MFTNWRTPTGLILSKSVIADKLRVELGPDLGDDACRLLLGKAAEQQGLVGERQAGGQVLRKHDGCSDVGKARQVAVVGRADDRGHPRIAMPRMVQQALDGPPLVEGHHEETRATPDPSRIRVRLASANTT